MQFQHAAQCLCGQADNSGNMCEDCSAGTRWRGGTAIHTLLPATETGWWANTASTLLMLKSAATGTGAADRPRDRTTRQQSIADFMAGCSRGNGPAQERHGCRQSATR